MREPPPEEEVVAEADPFFEYLRNAERADRAEGLGEFVQNHQRNVPVKRRQQLNFSEMNWDVPEEVNSEELNIESRYQAFI